MARWLSWMLLAIPAFAADLPPAAQALLNQARAANPARYQFALDHGVRIQATTDGKSFSLYWLPDGALSGATPLVVSLHGSESWAFDEFYLWHAAAAKAGYGIVALQWWLGGADAQAYYAPDEAHRELRAVLRGAGAKEGTALLHGFSRGGANVYGVAALDRSSGDRFYGMFLANAGGASTDFPPNVAISNGAWGYNVFAGSYWMMFCGGLDPNPERDGCPAMRRTSSWVAQFGGVADLFIEDAAAGHGGFHQTPAHIDAALEAFRRSQDARRGAPTPATAWELRPDPQFQIAGASIPNVGRVKGEVWLVVGLRGARLYRSADGSNAEVSETLPGLAEALAGTGYTAGEVVPRELGDGRRALFVLGLAGTGEKRSAVFRLVESGGRFLRDPLEPLYAAEPFVGVPDLTPAHDGKWRMTYVGLSQTPQNSRTAISADGGVTFQSEFANPFGDLAEPQPSARTNNVDPAALKLARGGYLAVTMREMRLYLHVSPDGRTYAPLAGPAIEAAQVSPGATGLFDPTLAEMPDGRIWMYVTAGQGNDSRVVRAEIVLGAAPASVLAVRNAASGAEAVAPGSIVSVYGQGLAAATAQATQSPLPLELGGAKALVNGRAAPLYYVSPTQLNLQLPFETEPGAAGVEVGTARAVTTVTKSAPGIFAVQGDYAALNAAAPGEVVSIYLTGQGAVSPAVATGAAAPVRPPSLIEQSVEVTVGGVKAEVLYAGLAPQTAGLAQINLRVPAVADGDQGVVVIIGGAASNTALLRVRAAASVAAPVLERVASRTLAVGTHRPELLVTPGGEIIVVVVAPEGAAFSTGQVKHTAYRFTADWQPVGQPFVVSRTTEEFGEPADQRAAIVNGELVVVYQTLIWREKPPVGGGPAEPYASEQSLMLARFTLDGQEILRRPIVAHVADNKVENFPDFCLLWRRDHLLVATGTLSGVMKLRRVDLNGNVLTTTVIETTEAAVPDNIGNSMLELGESLLMLSATGPQLTSALTVTELSSDLLPAPPRVFYSTELERHFPVGNLAWGDWILVGHYGRARGASAMQEQRPYAPYLMLFSRRFEELGELLVGSAGATGVHPTLARLGDRLLVAWSASVDLGARTAPQVHLDEYSVR